MTHPREALHPRHSRATPRIAVLFLLARFSVFLVMLLAIVSPGSSAFSQTEPPSPDNAAWEFAHLAGGVTLRGVVLKEREHEIDFAEIFTPPGRPMYAVVHGLQRIRIGRIEALPEAEHAQLLETFQNLRNRARIDAQRQEDVVLVAIGDAASARFRYDGDWFSLESNCDEMITRRCVVRVEQMFRAYRTLLPPRVENPARVEIRIFGDVDHYRQNLRELQLPLGNLAIYVGSQQLVLAGSDLRTLSDRLVQLQTHLASLQSQSQLLTKAHELSLARQSQLLKEKGFSAAEISTELRLRKNAFDAERAEVQAAAAAALRESEKLFQTATAAMISRLRHEAFHAYLDSSVFPRASHHVPIWLHEGLAQVFETAVLDGDSLRVDAPSPARLRSLAHDLTTAEALPLARLLESEQDAFLGSHRQAARDQHYLYAWGVAYHLAFEQRLLGSPALETYVEKSSAKSSPIANFEKLVGKDLVSWERSWHEHVRRSAAAK
ncbi:hypothetical protein Psta_3816 [Pirellula staleyi DSM 6068]|uniref:DUF1570 domain-containing protein n=1 Tax=Pirellula staleyi (strain ATCC 27377 / DSM 6068 / ICPB 4128) TaxID=530564 RepID=D2R0Y6_PIRSD|nr:DUF1570 domain-containing protein [Pirellula staleyi]ADB18471.1 hypothetical protein Psta_3816 [Pirellula staleyi DSM 6068]